MTGSASHTVFFPLAAAQGAIGIGLWSFFPFGETGSAWHAHEIVFGYAMAVIAGFLLTRANPQEVAWCLVVWLAARIAWMIPDTPDLVRAAAGTASTGTIAFLAGRSFLRGVKRAQNVVFPALLAALVLCEVAAQAGTLQSAPATVRSAQIFAVLLIVLLIVVMGGRITGAALSGLAQRAGRDRIPPQPVLERLLVAATIGIGVAVSSSIPALLAATAWVAAAGIVARLVSWRAGFGLAGPDLRAMAISHGFVALGLAGIGAGLFHPPWPEHAPLHLVTIGGIGIATVTMMLKTQAQRARLPLPATTITAAVVLLALGSIVRALGFGWPDVSYLIAAIAWIAAMALCLVTLLRRRGSGRERP